MTVSRSCDRAWLAVVKAAWKAPSAASEEQNGESGAAAAHRQRRRGQSTAPAPARQSHSALELTGLHPVSPQNQKGTVKFLRTLTTV